MIIRLYCLRDRVGDYMHPPVPFRTDAAALRSNEQAVAQAKGARPEDFETLFVGTFDDSTGEISYVQPVVVVPSVKEEG